MYMVDMHECTNEEFKVLAIHFEDMYGCKSIYDKCGMSAPTLIDQLRLNNARKNPGIFMVNASIMKTCEYLFLVFDFDPLKCHDEIMLTYEHIVDIFDKYYKSGKGINITQP